MQQNGMLGIECENEQFKAGMEWFEQNGTAWNGMNSNKMECWETKCEMERFGPGWNGLEQNGRHGECGSCG